MKISVDEKHKGLFIDPEEWELNFRWMKCTEHNQGAGKRISYTMHEFNVELDVCCRNFFNEILEKKIKLKSFRDDLQKLDERAAASEISETLLIGGVEVPEVEIISLASSISQEHPDGKDILWLTGNRNMDVPPEDLEKVKQYLEQRDKIRGVVRRYKISGVSVPEDEILDIIYKGKEPFLKLTGDRMFPINGPEIYAWKHIVGELKKSRSQE